MMMTRRNEWNEHNMLMSSDDAVWNKFSVKGNKTATKSHLATWITKKHLLDLRVAPSKWKQTRRRRGGQEMSSRGHRLHLVCPLKLLYFWHIYTSYARLVCFSRTNGWNSASPCSLRGRTEVTITIASSVRFWQMFRGVCSPLLWATDEPMAS